MTIVNDTISTIELQFSAFDRNEFAALVLVGISAGISLGVIAIRCIEFLIN